MPPSSAHRRKKTQALVAGIACFAMVVGAPSTHAAFGNIPYNTYVPNAPVTAIEVANGNTYIGGSFTRIQRLTGAGAPIDRTTGELDETALHVVNNGSVNVVIPDGDGGWFIGGTFTKIDNLTRNRIAHILPDGTLDREWNPGASSVVHDMVLNGSTLIVSGTFTSIGGESRTYLAALDADTGEVDPDWNPAPNSYVRSLQLSGSSLYIGGDFTSIGGVARSRLALLDADAGTLDSSWDPGPGAIVTEILLSADTLYLSGTFTTVGGVARNYLAAVAATGTGNLLPFDPNPDTQVGAMLRSGSTLYIAGGFTTLDEVSNSYLAAIDATTGDVIPEFAPAADDGVYALSMSDGSLYAGGNFTTIGGESRSRIAALDPDTGLATGWNPTAGGHSAPSVVALAVSGTTVYAGGDFSTMGEGEERNYLAAFSTTGALLPWNPDANGTVSALHYANSHIYAGGAFTTINGQTRNRIAAVEPTGTGQLIPEWSPSVGNGSVLTIATLGSAAVLLGGTFTTLNSVSRLRVGAVSGTGTGNLLSWNPSANGQVNTIATHLSYIYVGGNITAFAGGARRGIGQFSGLSNSPTTFNNSISVNHFVNTLAVGSVLYMGGLFSSVASNTRSRVAAVALNTTSVVVSGWNPAAGNIVQTIGIGASGILLGGAFTSMGGKARGRLALVDSSTGTVDSWNPNANANVSAVHFNGSDAVAGGAFTTVSGSYVPYFAYFQDLTTTTTTLESSHASATEGGEVTFTATLSNASAGGEFAFFSDNVSLGTAIIGRGSGSIVVDDLAVGEHEIQAVYSGDAEYAGSSDTLTMEITEAAAASTTTALASSQNPSTEGDSITLTATVSPSAATGTVTFYNGIAELGSATLGHGSGSYATSALAAGSHALTAAYGGNAEYLTSTSSTLTQVVNAAASGSGSSSSAVSSADASSSVANPGGGGGGARQGWTRGPLARSGRGPREARRSFQEPNQPLPRRREGAAENGNARSAPEADDAG